MNFSSVKNGWKPTFYGSCSRSRSRSFFGRLRVLAFEIPLNLSVTQSWRLIAMKKLYFLSRSVLPNGPVGQNGKLASGDELLEVGGSCFAFPDPAAVYNAYPDPAAFLMLIRIQL